MIRRARALLGTIVAISADAPAPAVEAAFAAVERVHELMSAQREDSDIGRINREGRARVHPWTFEVLERAVQISARTAGAFDVTAGHYSDLVLCEGTVAPRRPARVDVSSIAKGFAVDVAVRKLIEHGARAGCVNAGGDLRFFGDWPAAVRVRSPGELGKAVCLPASTHEAFATSSGYFGSRINGVAMDWSVTVAAASCLVADALTKAVALLGPDRSLLNVFGATAFAVDRDGGLHAAAG